MRLLITVPLVVGVLLAASGGLRAAEEKVEYEVVDEAEIYYGDTSDFKSPAVCDVDKVFNAIPEYREIVDRDLDDSDPRYLILMRAASDKFRTALDAAAEEGGYDLVGGLGSVRRKGKKGPRVPVITKLVVAKLPE